MLIARRLRSSKVAPVAPPPPPALRAKTSLTQYQQKNLADMTKLASLRLPLIDGGFGFEDVHGPWTFKMSFPVFRQLLAELYVNCILQQNQVAFFHLVVEHLPNNGKALDKANDRRQYHGKERGPIEALSEPQRKERLRADAERREREDPEVVRIETERRMTEDAGLHAEVEAAKKVWADRVSAAGGSGEGEFQRRSEVFATATTSTFKAFAAQHVAALSIAVASYTNENRLPHVVVNDEEVVHVIFFGVQKYRGVKGLIVWDNNHVRNPGKGICRRRGGGGEFEDFVEKGARGFVKYLCDKLNLGWILVAGKGANGDCLLEVRVKVEDIARRSVGGRAWGVKECLADDFEVIGEHSVALSRYIGRKGYVEVVGSCDQLGLLICALLKLTWTANPLTSSPWSLYNPISPLLGTASSCSHLLPYPQSVWADRFLAFCFKPALG